MSCRPYSNTAVVSSLTRVLTIVLFTCHFFDVALSQTSDWVTVHQNSWNGEPKGLVVAKYQRHHYTAAGEWNGNPLALWSNGTSLWVAEWRFSKLFSYDLVTFKRDSKKDFADFAITGNRSARGVWSDGTTIWVTDDFWDKLFAYDLVTRERLPDLDVETIAAVGNESPTGVWSNGEVMWVADDGDDKIYAYEFGTWQHLPGKDIDALRGAGNTKVADIWSDGHTMWVADTGAWSAWNGWSDGRLFAYDLSNRQRTPAMDIENGSIQEEAGMKSPNGIWGDGESLWISDRPGHKVFVFRMNTALPETTKEGDLDRDPSRDFRRLGEGGNSRPSQLWSNGSTIWVADNEDPLIYAYDLPTHVRQPDKDISLSLAPNERQLNPAGLWSDGETIWVMDWHTARAVAFDLESQTRIPERDVNALVESGNHHPSGMWSDGEVLWVIDSEDAAIYAYDLLSGQRRPNDEFKGLSDHGNSAPRGIWSDGVTCWIGDWETEKVYAYRWSDHTRVPEKDLNGLVAAGNLSPAGLWSDDQVLWISDHADSQIYSYPITTDIGEEPLELTLSIRPNQTPRTGWTIEFSGVLKRASSITGPFEIVEGARSPLEIANEVRGQFFIVEQE
ncbi:hypothetical protein N9B57_02925 [Verrucomicrobia bacterium]|nr:hypothetical protein [Verrucomicrobiota bacterium]